VSCHKLRMPIRYLVIIIITKLHSKKSKLRIQ
jgi:hypothetical protein